MTCTLNAFVSGAWSAREGEPVEVVDVAPNGKAAAVVLADAKKPVWIPSRWIDGISPPAPIVETPRCPCCGQLLPTSHKEHTP